MLMPITDLNLRSFWGPLSQSNRLFFLFFSGVSIYTLFLLLHVLVQLHSLKKRPARQNAVSAQPSLGTLDRRLANLRQLHLFTLYLFGFCIVFNIPNAFVSVTLSRTWPIAEYIQRLTFLYYFDAPIFLGFLLLHSLQWAVSARLDSFAASMVESVPDEVA
jgi:hypothetical protein